MRRRTPSEIKAYGDGYTEAYKEFCHLLKNHDVDKAIRKMKIFVDAVVLTVETTTGEPQTDYLMNTPQESRESHEIATDEPLTCRNKDHYADCEYKDNCNPVVCFKALNEFREMVTKSQKERSSE